MEMEMELYHYCPIPLEKGSIIMPGNWGRVIHGYAMPQTSNSIVVMELLLETVRLRLHPDLPCRLDSVYTCIGLDSFKNFRDRRKLDLCYHVELVDSSMPTFYGSWKHVESFAGTLEQWREAAEKYWSTDWKTESPETLELLSLSPIRILERISI